ncbi:MAG: transcriptional regulator [Bacilli bacterium]|nr:transcriptional regulator [Bacilli bacterium]
MKIKAISQLIQGESLTPLKENKDYLTAFACDLMSDCLAFINDPNCILITGLVNEQSLRTAEMLDIDCIIFVRGKLIPKEIIELGKKHSLTLISTKLTLFEVSGILYQAGIRPLQIR